VQFKVKDLAIWLGSRKNRMKSCPNSRKRRRERDTPGLQEMDGAGRAVSVPVKCCYCREAGRGIGGGRRS